MLRQEDRSLIDRRHLGGETVTGSTHSLDEAIMIVQCQRFAKATNMDIYSTLFNIHVSTPDMIQQLAASVDTLLMSQEKFQSPVFSGAHLHRSIADGDAMANGVQTQFADHNGFSVLMIVGTT